MQRDIDFAIWCARKCLHLWDAPKKVRNWLEDPKPETAEPIWAAAGEAAGDVAAEAAEWSSWSAEAAVKALWSAEVADADEAEAAAKWAAKEAADAAVDAAKALHTTLTDLKLEYVKTWTEDELGKADDDWIEVATVEILNRM